jgi:Tfp pilus assembly protein PilF
MNSGQWAEAGNVLEQALQLDPSLGVWVKDSLLKLAKCRWKQGDRNAAKHAAHQALGRDEGLAEAHNILAEVLMQEEAWDEAVREAHR